MAYAIVFDWFKAQPLCRLNMNIQCISNCVKFKVIEEISKENE